MIHTRIDGNGAELARHFDEARHCSLEHQLTKFGSRRGCIAAHTFFREAAPPILPAIGARFGMIPVKVFQFELTDITLCLVHLYQFWKTMQHHGGLVFAGMAYTSPAAFTIGI